MIELKRIYPECNADTFLVQLIFEGLTTSHSFGITEVAKVLKNFPDDNFIIGLIDTDKFKRDPPFIRDFTEVIENKLDTEGLLIAKLPNTNKHIIRLHPAFEKWIFSVAKVCDIDPTKYGFDTLDKFCRATKKLGVIKNEDVRGFLKEIIDHNPPAIQTLRYWLSKAVDNP